MLSADESFPTNRGICNKYEGSGRRSAKHRRALYYRRFFMKKVVVFVLLLTVLGGAVFAVGSRQDSDNANRTRRYELMPAGFGTPLAVGAAYAEYTFF
jgi:hypothetical protein